ncbi:MAG: type II toxin-antitoxin system HicB family antitoxin [Polaribacter sp.]
MKNTISYKNYFGTVEYSANNGCLFGQIIGINDLVNYEASSVEELKEAFEEAVEDYLSTCKEVGKEPNKFFKGVFNVRTGSKRHKELAFMAQQKQMKLNEIVNIAFDYLINNEEKIFVK